jgi:hypothetical protein
MPRDSYHSIRWMFYDSKSQTRQHAGRLLRAHESVGELMKSSGIADTKGRDASTVTASKCVTISLPLC